MLIPACFIQATLDFLFAVLPDLPIFSQSVQSYPNISKDIYIQLLQLHVIRLTFCPKNAL